MSLMVWPWIFIRMIFELKCLVKDFAWLEVLKFWWEQISSLLKLSVLRLESDFKVGFRRNKKKINSRQSTYFKKPFHPSKTLHEVTSKPFECFLNCEIASNDTEIWKHAVISEALKLSNCSTVNRSWCAIIYRHPRHCPLCDPFSIQSTTFPSLELPTDWKQINIQSSTPRNYHFQTSLLRSTV